MRKEHLFIGLIGLIYLASFFGLGRWTYNLHYGDSNGYYLHVVSFFVNNDVGDYDKTLTSLQTVNPAAADPREDSFGIRKTEKGRYYIKYTVGVPVMETPFFLLAHAYATVSAKYEANGWTEPYLLVVSFSIVFYVILGLFLLLQVLKNYYTRPIAFLTIAVVAISTNLLFQATYTTMAHGFLFFQHALLIFFTFHFYKNPNIKRAFAVGATVGLIALTRVPEVVSAFVPLLWGVVSWRTLRERVQFFWKNYQYILVAAAGFFLFFSLQMAYWYYVSGHLFFDPYKGEGFDFAHPHILSGWFDFANGWLIYTPVMIFALIGFFFMGKYGPAARWPLFCFVGIHSWVHYSYYAWTYFPGLGQRPMVETYALFAFALAAYFTFIQPKKFLKWLSYGLVAAFTLLNFFQTWQMNQGLIWSERGNAAFYWESFGQTANSRNALIAYESKQLQPDSNDVRLVESLYRNDFEDFTQTDITNQNVFNGNGAMASDQEFIWGKADFEVSQVTPRDWIRLGVQVYMEADKANSNRDNSAMLIIEFLDENDKKVMGTGLRMAPFIGNPTNSIWSAGAVNQWEEANYFCRVPKDFNENWTIKCSIWNPRHQHLYYDELRIDLYRDR